MEAGKEKRRYREEEEDRGGKDRERVKGGEKRVED